MTLISIGYKMNDEIANKKPNMYPTRFVSNKTISPNIYIYIKSVDLERTWSRLIQKCIVHTKLDI
jgi:hypothetical protein